MLFPFHDSNPIRRTPLVTCGIVAVNVASFLLLLRVPTDAGLQVLYYQRGFVPARLEQLVHQEPITVNIEQRVIRPFDGRLVSIRRPMQLQPEPRQIMLSLLSCMFLHGSWLHLIGNMWFLWLFGNNVEDRLGSIPFLLFYLAGGLLASGCHWMIAPHSTAPVIGASGAVAAVLGAYAITWPWARVHTLVFLFVFVTVIDLPALLVLGVWFLGQLLEANRVAGDLGGTGGVAWWAHVGGFIAGLLLMPPFSALIHGTPGQPVKDQSQLHQSDDYYYDD